MIFPARTHLSHPMVAFSVGALSMVGLPLAGFMSKWYLGWGALEANQLPFLLVLW